MCNAVLLTSKVNQAYSYQTKRWNCSSDLSVSIGVFRIVPLKIFQILCSESVCWGRRDGKKVQAKATCGFNHSKVRNPSKQCLPFWKWSNYVCKFEVVQIWKGITKFTDITDPLLLYHPIWRENQCRVGLAMEKGKSFLSGYCPHHAVKYEIYAAFANFALPDGE